MARDRLAGRAVRLERGPEATDGYGRVLAYVHLPANEHEVDFNLIMIAEGLATAYRRFEHPRREAYIEAERRARAEGKGLWRDATRTIDD